MAKKSLRQVDCAGKRTLVRVDFNVPLDKNDSAIITDDTRIRAACETIEHLISEGAMVTLCSHMGRPKGKRNANLSLKVAADRLAELIGVEVAMAPDCIGQEVADLRAALQPGQVLMLGNTRFHPEEKANDPDFAKALAGDAELFVDDAFGSMHRAHASTVGVTDYVGVCVSGFLVERELEMLPQVRAAEGDGFIVIMGGAKVEGKIDAIKRLLPRAEKMIIGGAMAWAFFSAQGKEVGESLCTPKSVEAAKDILCNMADHADRLILPVDVHMVQEAPDTGEIKFGCADCIEPGWNALDIGLETQELYAQAVKDATVVFWNGPMGFFEKPPFDEGTVAVAQALADTDAYTVVGGGDSAAAMTQLGFADRVSHVSTGGGASIEYVQGDDLPGVQALDEA